MLGIQPPHVRVEGYVPQTQVLRHCAVIATHGGSGTFLAALGRGIPQLCLPQGADQFINAAACVRAGVGLALAPADATPVAIAGAVDRLLTEPAFRARAAHLAATIAAMPGPDDVVPVLERLATEAADGRAGPAGRY